MLSWGRTAAASNRELLPAVPSTTPSPSPAAFEQHLACFGEAYADTFSEGEIRAHIQAFLTPEHPHLPGVFVRQTVGSGVVCTVAGQEFPAVFSLLTGFLGAHGMNIRSGDVFTASPPASSRPRRRPFRRPVTPVRRRIIDRFEGAIPEGADFDEWATAVRQQLAQLFDLLHSEAPDDVLRPRELVHEQVARRLNESPPALASVLYPVEVEIDTSGPTTRLLVRAQDTPFFLYSMGCALALSGVSVERVRIATHADQIEDELEVLDVHGRKIESADKLDLLRFSVLLTKQFTFFLGSAPDPYAALQRFEQLAEDIFGSPDRSRWSQLFGDAASLHDLARVLGASDYLWEDFIRNQYEELLPLLGNEGAAHLPSLDRQAMAHRLDAALARDHDKKRALNQWKDQETFHIDLHHILTPEAGVRELAEPLCRVAELALDRALTITYGELAERYGHPRTVGGLVVPCALLGLGKFGGVAMGYASDIEILLVYSDNGRTDGQDSLANSEFFDRVVRDGTAMIVARRQGVFEIDLRLRPYGKSGPLACSLDNFCRYYGPDGPALDYERLALTRLRAVAGDRQLGERIQRLRDAFIYETQSISVKAVVDLRRKQVETKGADRRLNAKFSPGALVDLEYCVQLLQVSHGGTHPELRTPRIHEALNALSKIGILTAGDSLRLTKAYYFMRDLINALRMLRGNARDLFLPEPDSLEYRHVARRMGFSRRQDLDAGRQLHVELEMQSALIREFYERHLGRDAPANPALGSIVDLILADEPHPEQVSRVCSRIGVEDTARALVNLRSLAGEGRRHEQFCRLAVLAGDVLASAASDQDMALNNWERFVSRLPNPGAHFEQLLLQPSRLDILLRLFAGSQFLADTLRRNPEFLDWATDPAILRATHDRQRVLHDLVAFCGEPAQTGEWLDALRRFRRRAILRIAARDLCLGTRLERVTAELSALAEASVQVALQAADGSLRAGGLPAPPSLDSFCIFAFGKLGGGELNYSSDIDLLGVCAAVSDDGGESTRYFAKVLERTRDNLTTHTSEGYAYRVDFRLRPFGRSGPLVVSVPSITRYYWEHAALWELQAQLKLRPIAGNLVLGYGVLTTIRQVAASRSIEPGDVARSIRRLRDMASQRREGETTLDVKDGPGGIRDIEFLVQGLQLTNLCLASDVGDANTLRALAVLERRELLPVDEAGELREAYLFLRRLEHMLQLLEDRQVHVLPAGRRELLALARRLLDSKATGEALLDRVRATRQRVREIYDSRLPDAP
jgi:glutamate-ammonia-ligase adenylyltransferase